MSYFDETLVIKLQGIRVEGVPSLWYFPSLDLLVAGVRGRYCRSRTGCVAAELANHIKVDAVAQPGRYLGETT